jgi:hypothetical protein
MGVKQPSAAHAPHDRPALGTRPDRVRLAAGLLHSLLLQREAYLHRWQPLPQRARTPGVLSQDAVAQVIARYLWDRGERPERMISLPRDLKDRICRTLRGQSSPPGP